MRIARGSQIETMDGDVLRRLVAGHEKILVDLGTGTGAYVYETARRHPRMFCIGVDAEARNMAEASARSLRKLARGGLPNVLYVLAAAEEIPSELHGLASHVSINLPWGSLLRGVVLAEDACVQGIASVARPGAALEILLSYDARYEPRMMQKLGLPLLSPDYLTDCLTPAYARWGIRFHETRALDNDAVMRLPLAWGRDLTRTRARQFFYILGRIGRDTAAPVAPLLRPRCQAHPPAPDPLCFTAQGHANIVAEHPVSIEFTRDADVTERGDCIVGVAADFDSEDLGRLLEFRKLGVTLRVDEAEDSFACTVNPGFACADEMVFRKSAFRSPRTLGIRATKSARQLDRALTDRLRNPCARIEVALVPQRPRRRGRPAP